ncbi:MAG: metallophosphoesterase family protein [Methanobacteriota archaeon]
MQVAIISDIHSNLPALREVLKEIKGMRIFCCGDLVGYAAFPNEVIELVREKKIISILGNHDHAVITGNVEWFNPVAAFAIDWTRKKIKKENLDFLSSLPRFHEGEFYMVHGSPRNQLDEYVSEDYPEGELLGFFKYTSKNAIILGHTHEPFIKKLGDKLIFNPGSVGQPRDLDPRAAYAIFDIAAKKVEVKKIEYDIDEAANAIIENGLPEILAHRLYEGW